MLTSPLRRYRPKITKYGARKIYRRRYTQRGMGLIARPIGRAAPEIKSLDTILYNDSGVHTVPNIAGLAGIGASNAFTTGLSALNLVTQGATFYQRIGAKITVKSIAVDMILTLSSPGSGITAGRIMLIYDRQTNGAYPSNTDFLQDNDAGTVQMNSGINMTNRSRFLIIRDTMYSIDPAQKEMFNYHVYCQGRWDAEYSTNTGLIGDIRTGAIFLLNFCYNSASVTVTCAKARIRYFD